MRQASRQEGRKCRQTDRVSKPNGLKVGEEWVDFEGRVYGRPIKDVTTL